MKKFYITSGLAAVLYLYYSFTSNEEAKAMRYFRQVVSDRMAVKNGTSIQDSALFAIHSLVIDAPSELFQAKYKNKGHDSAVVYVHNVVKSNGGENLKFLDENGRLTVQLNTGLKPFPPSSVKYRSDLSEKSYANLLITTENIPENTELKAFTSFVLNMANSPGRRKMTFTLREGAQLVVNGLQADTLLLHSECNSFIYLIQSDVQNVIHHFEGGKIKDFNTKINSYSVKRTKPSWCTSKAELTVKETLSGEIDSDATTVLALHGSPENVLKKSKSTSIQLTENEKQTHVDDFFIKFTLKKYGITINE